VARTRLNPRLVKANRSYTVEEIARLFGLHRNTVRSWIKDGGLQAIDRARPLLVQGQVLRAFLESRRSAARHPCPPGTLYCFRCREPRRPALGMADFAPREQGAGDLSGLCEVCGAVMHRRASHSALGAILPGVEVRVVQAPPRIADCPHPSLKQTFG